MKVLFLSFLLVIPSTYIFAQKSPIKFGDVPLEDLKMTHYEKDTTAEALVLTDFGQTEFKYSDKGWQLFFERIVRIKILTTGGSHWGDFKIPLYIDGSNREKLTQLKAVTYNLENGKVQEIKMKNDAVFQEKSSENIELVSFALPGIKQGSVIEVSYNITSDFLFNFQDWKFQSEIPTRWSEYRATFPEFFKYERYMQGYISLTVNESKQVLEEFSIKNQVNDTGMGGRGVYTETHQLKSLSTSNRWVAEDVPGFKEEPFLTTPNDYISRINFELSRIQYPNQMPKSYMGTWVDLNTSMLDNAYFGAPLNGSGFLKRIVEEITASATTPQERIVTIQNYVKSTVEWDGRSTKFLDSNLKEPLEEKKGSSAEINLLLAALLLKAGFDANPVLISTRDHGFLREDFPMSSQFNYVVCHVTLDGKSYLLDATDRLLPNDLLPERCLNGKGLLVSKAGYSWVPLSTTTKSKVFIKSEFGLTSVGEIAGNVVLDRTNYFARAQRKKYFQKGEDVYTKEIANDLHCHMDSSAYENADKIGQSFKETHTITISDQTITSDNLIYFNPLLLWKMEENPFKLEDRKYPVDFGSPFDRTYISKITLPADFAVEELPKSKVLVMPNGLGKYTYSISQVGDALNFSSILQINRSIFTQEDYPALREFYSQILAKQAEQVVLKRK